MGFELRTFSEAVPVEFIKFRWILPDSEYQNGQFLLSAGSYWLGQNVARVCSGQLELILEIRAYNYTVSVAAFFSLDGECLWVLDMLC